MSILYLKVKIRSLAAEARIIRQEELRLRDRGRSRPLPAHLLGVREGLRLHRVNDVRTEARAALLAYGFLRGRPLEAIERPGSAGRPEARIRALVTKYGAAVMPDQKARLEALARWLEGKGVAAELVAA